MVDTTIAHTRYVTAVFESRHAIEPQHYELTWDELATGLSTHRVYASKHAAWLWSPTLYRAGATRGREGVESISLLVADIDDGTPVETLRFWLRTQAAHVIVSTWSHTPEVPHLRVIVPLLRPIPAAQYDEVWRRFNAHVFHAHIDPSTKDCSRMFYAPGCSVTNQPYAFAERFDDAPPLDWTTLPAVADPIGGVSFERLVTDTAARTELERRARSFLSKWYRDLAGMPPASGRHNALLAKARAAGGLIATGLLSEREAYEVLLAACEANGLLSDPGGAAEKTLRDGLEHGAAAPWTPDSLPDTPAWRARLEGPRMGSKKPVSVPVPLREIQDTSSFELFETARQVAEQALPRVAWIVRPWIAEGGLTEVDGKVKQAGKTTWLLALIRCVLDGEAFMGQDTLQTPVVLLSEQNPRSLQQALFRAGLEAHDDLHILFWHKVRDQKWDHVVDLAAAKCQEIGARLLAVDTLGQFVGLRGDSENNSGDALASMQPLQAAIARDGIAVVFNRHERKSGGEVGDSGRGSSAFAGAVDIILSLRRAGQELRPTARHLHALSRFDETPQRTVIELQGMRYVVLGSEERVLAGQAEEAILAALGATDEGLTADELIEETTLHRTELYTALKVLRASGRIRRTGSGGRGNKFRYFVAHDDDDAV